MHTTCSHKEWAHSYCTTNKLVNYCMYGTQQHILLIWIAHTSMLQCMAAYQLWIICFYSHYLKGKKKVLATALGFGPGWRQLGLPHPIPIACVGCGSCDTELLEAIAKVTRGMFVIVGHVSELSTFFRRQASGKNVIAFVILRYCHSNLFVHSTWRCFSFDLQCNLHQVSSGIPAAAKYIII